MQKLSGAKTKEIMERLIRSEFDKYIDPMPYEIEIQEELIQTALKYGFVELAEQMKKDL